MYTVRTATNKWDAMSFDCETLAEALDLIAIEAGWCTNGELLQDGHQLLTWRKV